MTNRPPRVALGATRGQVVAAFATVYVIWGSTYLAIHFAVLSMPPFLMAATRFLIAGALLYGWVRLRGAPRPQPKHWKSAAIMGTLLLAFGNGLIVVAEQTVPSGIAALLVAMVPIWMVLLDWFRPGGVRPRAGVLVGLALGMGGVALLMSQGASGPSVFRVGSMVLLIMAPLAWAIGSLYGRDAAVPSVPLLATAMEMLCGGLALVVLSVVTGELGQVHLSQISLLSLLSLGYLVVFGSLLGYSAYVFLLRNVPAARVSTYAYVNPAVAVALGWAFAGERITPRTIVAAAIIVAAVALITLVQSRAPSIRTTAARTPASPPAREAPLAESTAAWRDGA